MAGQRPPVWTLTFENQEPPPSGGLRMAYNQRNNIPMNNFSSGGNDEDSDNLDNNYFGDTIIEQDVHQMEDDNIIYYTNRIHSIHRHRLHTRQNNNLVHSYEARAGIIDGRRTTRHRTTDDVLDSIENHADLIVAKMEQDAELMEDSPQSEELRKEALRDMPQCLTLKRCVKVKLSKSVSQKSKRKPLGYFKMFKYRMSISISKFKQNLRNMAYSLELWYGTVKEIEGNFGSGVASFFKFLRWMFMMNVFIAVLSFFFVVLPQVTFGSEDRTIVGGFNVKDIFSGEGNLTDTFLYYGFYSNHSVSLSALTYNMPDAYFFTLVSLYLCCFFTLSFSVAVSYRRSFIETEGGLKNVYAHKIFCGWDYNIAKQDAAILKSNAIFNELRELLFEAMHIKKKDSCIEIFWVRTMQVMMNLLYLILLVGIGYLMWFLMDKSNNENWPSIYTALLVNAIMAVFPIIFSWVIKYEGYKNPKNMLSFTLIRTFILGFVIIGVLVTFWLKNPDSMCWETSLGQEVYRLILFDFIFSVLLVPLIDLIVYGSSRFCFEKNYLHFDIARNTMQVIYNQTLLWVGLFFSPFLAVIIVLKLFLLWYVKKSIVLKLCTPSSKTWRAAQTTTWFLMMAFLSLLLVMGVLGYIITYVETTSCGPFSQYDYMYEIVTLGLLKLKNNSDVFNILLFVTKPGFIALIMIALCARVYYLRAKAQAQRGIVAIYREMLVWDSRDKEFLLQNISKVTKGQWQYKLQEGRKIDPIISSKSVSRYRGSQGDANGDTLSQELLLTGSSTSSDPSSISDSVFDDKAYSHEKYS